MGQNSQIRALADRVQIGAGAAAPLPVLLRDLIKADPLLFCAIEIIVQWIAGLPGGADKYPANFTLLAQIGDVQRPIDAVIGGRTAFLMLGAFEQRQ